jgi:hypothetical protein
MDNIPKIQKYETHKKLVERFRDDFQSNDFVLLYAFNGTGKTRLSMEFKEKGKNREQDTRDTLYFNAFTEDLFSWDNDLVNDEVRVLEFNAKSNFFSGFKQQAVEERIASHLSRYSDFSFDIDYDKSVIKFKRDVIKKVWEEGKQVEKSEVEYNIKISRGEENIFVWCIFLAICELSIDNADAYKWVKYFYIDDPISSLDENNAIAVASDLARILKKGSGKIKTVITSHHSLFFNVMCNELKLNKHVRYFLHKFNNDSFTLQKTNDTPFFHHVASLSELKELAETEKLNTHHFNLLRSVLEKTSSFMGYNDFGDCIKGIEDKALFERALNLLSHGNYSIFDPTPMLDDNKDLFKRVLNEFLKKYEFQLPKILLEETKQLN